MSCLVCRLSPTAKLPNFSLIAGRTPLSSETQKKDGFAGGLPCSAPPLPSKPRLIFPSRLTRLFIRRIGITRAASSSISIATRCPVKCSPRGKNTIAPSLSKTPSKCAIGCATFPGKSNGKGLFLMAEKQDEFMRGVFDQITAKLSR